MYKLLIVDDEKLICEGMRRALKRLGQFELFVAHSGVEALKAMAETAIDAMLLDISMPDMDGMALMRTLESRETRPLTVIISGYDEFAYAKQALTYGAVDYVLKPLDSDDVIGLGEKLLTLLKKRDAARARTPEPAQPPAKDAEADASDSPGRIARRIKACVEQHYADSRLNVNAISALMNYSPNYLGSAFKRAHNLSINDYLAQYRVRQAKRLMDETDMMIYEIAFRVGFTDQHYFSKTFKKYVGMTPSEYRSNR